MVGEQLQQAGIGRPAVEDHRGAHARLQRSQRAADLGALVGRHQVARRHREDRFGAAFDGRRRPGRHRCAAERRLTDRGARQEGVGGEVMALVW